MADLFETYNQETIALAKSLVIKFGFTNVTINNRLRELGHIVSEDPYTWKYNLNLAGLYHPNDKVMTVVSNDTQEEIQFTKENLASHPRTKSDYRPGKEGYYEDLVAEYPLQRVLIKSLTRDITLRQVVEARDFQIIDWDRDLVAENEVSLIRNLQRWIDDYVMGNWNQNAMISDPLYASSFIAVMVQHIPKVIMNLRKEKSHTFEASSFHVWTYLGGFYNLDKYRNVLNHKQAMWLYFNIRRIRQQLGQSSVMEELEEILIREAGMRLNSLRLRTNEDGFETTLEKNAYFYKEDTYDKTIWDEEDTRYVLTKMTDLGINNEEDLERDIVDLERRGRHTPINDRIVGVVEAEQLDESVAQNLNYFQKRWDYAIYLAHLGLYEPEITIQLPNGRERILKVRDVVILYFFALNTVYGESTVTIPTITIDWLMPRTYPSFLSLRSFFTDNVSDEDINAYLSKKLDLSVRNSAEFDDLIVQVMGLHQWQELDFESKEGSLRRSEYEQLGNALWATETCQLAFPGTTYNDWLSNVQINKYDFSTADWSVIADRCLMAITGEEIDSSKLPIRQQNMLDIFDTLTSYTLRYIVGDSAAKFIDIEIPSLHYEVELVTFTEDHYWPIGLVYDTDEMEVEITVEISAEGFAEEHIWLEENELEWIIEVGSEINLDEVTGELIEYDVQGPGGVIYDDYDDVDY